MQTTLFTEAVIIDFDSVSLSFGLFSLITIEHKKIE